MICINSSKFVDEIKLHRSFFNKTDQLSIGIRKYKKELQFTNKSSTCRLSITQWKQLASGLNAKSEQFEAEALILYDRKNELTK